MTEKKLIASCAWKIMADPSTSDAAYTNAELIYELTADKSVSGDRPMRVKLNYIIANEDLKQ